MDEQKKGKCCNCSTCKARRGPRGFTGLRGYAGPPGERGENGLLGERGPRGYMGFQGVPGVKGDTCSQGETGLQGNIGPQGEDGVKGDSGIQGIIGPQGKTGSKGKPGISGGIAEFAHIYSTDIQRLSKDESLKFNSNGILTEGFLLNEGKRSIIVKKAGIYEIIFQVSALQQNQFSLFANGVAIPNTTFSSTIENPQNNGLTILSLASNSELTLRNHTLTTTYIDLQTDLVSKEILVNASLTIKKLS